MKLQLVVIRLSEEEITIIVIIIKYGTDGL
jgi:hypothetical protein